MKKKLLAVFAVSALFGLSSCSKAEKLLFKPFESPLSFDITIPVVSSTSTESSMGSTTLSYNVDSLVKAKTDNAVDPSVVSAMYIQQIAITITDPVDNNNSLSNFNYVKMNVSQNGTPYVFGPFNVTPGAMNQDSYTVSNSPNIRPFFNGSAVTFSLVGQANKATTHEMHATVSATIKFDK
ncbi:MAG: hypothetical protein ACXVBK_10350 [Flavisolibacter sp.]